MHRLQIAKLINALSRYQSARITDIRIHKALKPYKCSYCRSDKLFRTSSSRKIHVVQAFYRENLANLTLITKEGFLTDFGPETCPL